MVFINHLKNKMELEEKFKEAIYQRPTLDGAQICVKIAEEFSIGFLNFVENSQFCLINNNYIDMKTDTNVDVKKNFRNIQTIPKRQWRIKINQFTQLQKSILITNLIYQSRK